MAGKVRWERRREIAMRRGIARTRVTAERGLAINFHHSAHPVEPCRLERAHALSHEKSLGSQQGRQHERAQPRPRMRGTCRSQRSNTSGEQRRPRNRAACFGCAKRARSLDSTVSSRRAASWSRREGVAPAAARAASLRGIALSHQQSLLRDHSRQEQE